MILVAYLGSAVRANAFGSHRISLRPTEDVKKPQPSSPEELALEAIAKLRTGRLLYEVAHQMELVYRLAVFDTFLNNLTSYALASFPTKAIGSSQIPVGVLLAKTRGTVINDCIARRAKSLARDTLMSRVQALCDITGANFYLPDPVIENLKRLTAIRNTVVHEGVALQFTVDEDLRFHSHVERRTIELPALEGFFLIDWTTASIYEQYVTDVIGRELTDYEIEILKNSNPRWPLPTFHPSKITESDAAAANSLLSVGQDQS